MRRSRSTARKRKLPVGWPPRTRLLTCRGTRSTSGTPMPRRGCPNTAPSTGCARSTATNPGTTNCAPKPSITVARPCTPTLRTIQGCSSDHRPLRSTRRPRCASNRRLCCPPIDLADVDRCRRLDARDHPGDSSAEVITASTAVNVLLDPHMLSVRWRRIGEQPCDGAIRSNGQPCACPRSLAQRRAAAKHGHGCKPGVRIHLPPLRTRRRSRARSCSASEPAAVQLGEATAAVDQVTRWADFDHSAALDDRDLIGLDHRGQAVGDDDGGAPLAQPP